MAFTKHRRDELKSVIDGKDTARIAGKLSATSGGVIVDEPSESPSVSLSNKRRMQYFSTDDFEDGNPLSFLEFDIEGNHRILLEHALGSHLLFASDGAVSLHSKFNLFLAAELDFALYVGGKYIIQVEGDLIIDSGNASIKFSGDEIIIDAASADVKIYGGNVSIGNVPLPPQGFCSVPNCIFSGVPITTNTMPAT